jgi:hypothetical protein
MSPLFVVAQKTLGVSANNDIHFCYGLDALYNNDCVHGVYTYDNPSIAINFVRLLKCANTAIGCNLGVFSTSKVKSSTECHAPVGAGPSASFAYVREPQDHFISGYAQVFETSSEGLNVIATQSVTESRMASFPAGSQAQALAFVQDTMAFKQLVSPFKHTWPLTSTLHPWVSAHGPLEFIGRTEHLDRGWRVVQSLTKGQLPSFNSSCNEHASSPGNEQYKSAMTDLITSNRSIALVVGCALKLPDYVCLGYPQTFTDQECVEAGYANSLAEWGALVADIRQYFCPQPLAMVMWPV